ncbi:MAG: DNA repair protein RadA [Proteobacteria bacterium]|nr:DNA repair protein RadA [Pseudomonadota bacterium]
MGKKVVEYTCEACGAKFPKWTGRCGHCGEWGSLKENALSSKKPSWVESENRPRKLGQIQIQESEERWRTEVDEFDRVVGGGIVKGSIGLLGGTPGVGKSTLILQLLARLVKIGKRVLYVSGEESANQIKHRADRLAINQDDILVLIESNLEQILDNLKEHRPDFVVIDSIQTLYTDQLSASAGSVSQVRESASVLMQYAKQTDTAVMLIGHVTKEGDIAGPRTLEHMVDCVLYLEGEKKEKHRILRSVKNRFGTVNEVGLFKMTGKGLAEISQPNSLFVDKFVSDHPGTAVFAANEGSRTLFMEVQILVGDTQQSYPARTSMGLDRNRLQLIVAVLEKHLSMDFSRNDIYVNLAGGFRVVEPAIDLSVAAALISSHSNLALPLKSVFVGEIALTGEFRNVPSLEDRLYESERCGFERVFLPAQSLKSNRFSKLSLQLVPVNDIQELYETLR